MDPELPRIQVLDAVLSAADLELLRGFAATLPFEPQDLGRGVIARRSRAVTTQAWIPALLWERLSPVLPPLVEVVGPGPGRPRLDPPLEAWTPVGCNPLTRFYRYGRGASFSEHEDEPWNPDPHTRTLLTVLVYLPVGGCTGGETVIDGMVVSVVEGRTVIFDHGLLHEGKPVERGEKLTLRSDIVASPRTA